MSSATPPQLAAPRRWYEGVTRYQWFILVICCLGWMFDAYEGQIYGVTRNDLLSEILRTAHDAPEVKLWGDRFLGFFLVGGATGGIFFAMLADRWGRKPVMVLTILFFSVFVGLIYFAAQLWQIGVLLFLVGMGVGGEWAVGATLVAEVFPQHARAHASGIFHSSSCLGNVLAPLVGLAVGAAWRYAYLVSVLPALLVLVVWARVEEPQTWLAARDKATTGQGVKLGSFRELFLDRVWGPWALLGMVLAAVGLGTFWSVTVAGQDLAKQILIQGGAGIAAAESGKNVAYIVEIVGMAVGLLSFGPVCERIGRRWTFILFQSLSLLIVPLTCYGPGTYWQLLLLLPLYGACTLSIHAGFAIYFPELFPSRLRSTGAGFCFNAGRLLAAPVMFFSGSLKGHLGLGLAITLMNLLFLLGIGVVLLLPETKGQPLPE
jgi:MFS family permease